jgi:hypothetical protein
LSRCFLFVFRNSAQLVRAYSSQSASTAIASEPHKEQHLQSEVTTPKRGLPPGVRQVTIPDNEWDTVLFSARNALKALDELVAKCKQENYPINSHMVEKFRAFLEKRAANEVMC